MKRSALKRTTALKKKTGFNRVRRDYLDELFSEFIRRRAMQRVGGCERCLHPKQDIPKENGEILPAWKQLQCCHFDGRSNKRIRYDPDNAGGFCGACHNILDGHPFEKVEWVKQHLGEQRYNMLQGRLHIVYPKIDKKAIELYLRHEIKEMESSIE